MFARVRLCLGAALAAAVLTPAAAATVDLSFDRFDRTALASARGAMSDFLATRTVRNLRLETFDGYSAWDGHAGSVNPQHTRVGSFDAFGAAGSGHSVVGDPARLQVRSDTMRWGRYDTDALGGKWLDSNDNLGMKWEVSGAGKFNALAFFVLDAADVGGRFSIKVGDTLYSDLAGAGGKLANGNIHFVRILLSEAVESLTVELMHNRTNDGFGIDGAMVARVAPVPLPPAAALMLPGLLALAALRRRRAA
jgi:hypothetical protein